MLRKIEFHVGFNKRTFSKGVNKGSLDWIEKYTLKGKKAA